MKARRCISTLRSLSFLIAGRPFLYQTIEGNVYHVTQNGVEEIWSYWSPKIHIVAFVDGDKGESKPKCFLFQDSVQIIVVSYPEGANQRWIEKVGNFTIITKLATSLWSPRELFLTGLVFASPSPNARLIHFFRIFLYSGDITFKLLRKSTLYIGYNPRECFGASFSVTRLEAKREEVRRQITYIARKPIRILQELDSCVVGASVTGSALSHTIFQPSPSNKLRQLETCDYKAVSRWVFDYVLDVCETHEADAVAKLYRGLSVPFYEPRTVSLRGCLFERQVLNYLDGIDTHRNLSIHGLAYSDERPWTYRGPIGRFTFQESATVIDKIKNAVGANEPLHLVLPSAPNFPDFDSIFYYPNDVLTCIQITINHKHPIAVSGLQRIQRWLKLHTMLADLCPKRSRPWRYIFIVPSHMASTFTLQELEGDTAEGEWAGKVDQYVLGLKVRSVDSCF